MKERVKKMIAPKLNLVGIRRYTFDDTSRNRITAYFAYEDKERVEGIATLTFSLFENNRSFDVKSLKVGNNYSVVYHRNGQYYQVDDIRPV